MKKRSFETLLLLLLLAHNLSSVAEFFTVSSSGDARLDERIPQEKTIPPPGANAILGGCTIGPVYFSDGLETATSL